MKITKPLLKKEREERTENTHKLSNTEQRLCDPTPEGRARNTPLRAREQLEDKLSPEPPFLRINVFWAHCGMNTIDLNPCPAISLQRPKHIVPASIVVLQVI